MGTNYENPSQQQCHPTPDYPPSLEREDSERRGRLTEAGLEALQETALIDFTCWNYPRTVRTISRPPRKTIWGGYA